MEGSAFGRKPVRRRPFFRQAPSMSSNAESEAGVGPGRVSVLSRFSKKSTMAATSLKSYTGSEIVDSQQPEGKRLKLREYLLILIEGFLSLTAYVIRERNLSPKELKRINQTSRQAEVFMLYAEGWSSLLGFSISVLADSYFKYYTMALFSVILHFATICLVFMEDTIIITHKGNPYADLVRNACTVSLVLIKSSDFMRFIYGVTGIATRRRSTLLIFIFFQFWVSSTAGYGGMILNGFMPLFQYYHINLCRVAFVGTGFSLYLFVYVLRPEVPKKLTHGLGCRVIGCFVLASYYRAFSVKRNWRKAFFSEVEGTYDKTTISRSKEIFQLWAFLLPFAGIVFSVEVKFNLFYAAVANKVKSNDYIKVAGLTQIARNVMCMTMLLSYFGLWPLLTLMGIKKKLTVKFLVGYLLAVVTLFYGAVLMRTMLDTHISGDSGYIRVYNTRESPVYFHPEDRKFSTHDFSVSPKSGETVAYPCSSRFAEFYSLFPVRVYFKGTTNNVTVSELTMYLAVRCDETIGYVVLDPPEIVRIRGLLPIREGPPGSNNSVWPRVFMYSAAYTLQGTTVLIGKELTHHHPGKIGHDFPMDLEKKTFREDVIEKGKMKTVVLEPGFYHFKIHQTEIEAITRLEEGAVYGLLVYTTASSRLMDIDVVIPPNEASGWAYLGLFVIHGFAIGLAYPALRGMILSISPHGLVAMSFGFIGFLEGVSLWIIYLGFVTWHPFISSYTLLAYSFGVSVFFFLSIFFLLKFWKIYQGMVIA